MNWITPKIAIGNHTEAADVVALSKEDVHAVLGLIETLSSQDAADMGLEEICVVLLHDGPFNPQSRFVDAINALERMVEKHGRVLVHCHLGRSRSAAVVAGYLMRAEGITKEAALKQIAAKREIYITAGIEAMLDELE